MDTVAAWLQSTALSHAIVAQTWIWPAAETLHFIGLALVLGIIGVLDLRLMGWFPQVPVRAFRGMVPFAVGGFSLNVLTGLVFLVGHPEQYAHNVAFWWKVGALVVAGANAAVFEATLAPAMMRLAPGDATPLGAKCIGAVSMAAWIGVLFWGRMLPFVGNAF